MTPKQASAAYEREIGQGEDMSDIQPSEACLKQEERDESFADAYAAEVYHATAINVDRFWEELHEEAEKQYDRRLELLGPIETADDAAFRKTLHDGWSAWLMAKRIVYNRRLSTLQCLDPPTFENLRGALEGIYNAVSESDFPTIPDKYYHHVLNASKSLAATEPKP